MKLAEGRQVDLHEEKDFLGEVELRKREKVRQELEFRNYLKEVDEYHKVKAEKRFTDTKVERALACAETIRENQKVLIRETSAYKSGIKESKGQYLDFLKKQAQLDSLNRQINLKQEQEVERNHKGLIDNLTRNPTSRRPGYNADLEKQIYEQEKILSELKDWNTTSEQDFQTTRDNYYDKYVSKQHRRTKDRTSNGAMLNQLEEMAEKRQTQHYVKAETKAKDTELMEGLVAWDRMALNNERAVKKEKQQFLNSHLQSQMAEKKNPEPKNVYAPDREARFYGAKYIDRFNCKNVDQRAAIATKEVAKQNDQAAQKNADKQFMRGLQQFDQSYLSGMKHKNKEDKTRFRSDLLEQMEANKGRFD